MSGRKSLKQYILKSSISEIMLLEDEVVMSRKGNACTLYEAVNCSWSALACLPDDIRVCELTGLGFHSNFMSQAAPAKLEMLVALLNTKKANADRTDLWTLIEEALAATIGGKVAVEAAQISPDGKQVAVCGENKKFLGFKIQHVGGLYSIDESRFMGRIVVGRRRDGGWIRT